MYTKGPLHAAAATPAAAAAARRAWQPGIADIGGPLGAPGHRFR